MDSSFLFSPHSLGTIVLKNRVVMAPMTRSRAVENNTANELMATYYGQRAGAGLQITEGTAPSPNGVGYPRIPAMFTEEHAAGWKKVTDAVHAEDGRIFLQVMHTGRVSHVDNLTDGGEVLAPSAKTVSGEMYVDGKGNLPHTEPREMTEADIQTAVGEYKHAAELAMEAGFDGIELHGANGYLIEQFLNPLANVRTDAYGGSSENRIRFLVEVAQAVSQAIGAHRVGLRISPYGVFNDMGGFDGIEETFNLVAATMGQLGLAYIHIVDHSGLGAPEVPQAIKTQIRDAFGGTIILSGNYDRERAEQDLQAGLGHLVAFGRPFISNPDLVTRMEKGAKLAAPNPDTFYTPGAEGYTDYPSLTEDQA